MNMSRRILTVVLFVIFLSAQIMGKAPAIKEASPSFIISVDYVAVPEGGTVSFTVRLSAEPPGDVTAYLYSPSGDTNIFIPAGVNPVSIPKASWNTPVTLTLQAAEDPDSVDGTAVYQVWESVTSYGIPMVQLTARELDNDNVMDVGGTLADNTVWDSSRNYRLTSTLTVPSGISLTIQPGVSIIQNGVFRAFEINGSLTAQDNFFLLNTRTDWDGGDVPAQRQNAFNFYGTSQGVFKRCVFQCIENSNHSVEFYDDWSAAVWITDTSQVSIRGSRFYSLNSINGWRTVYGVKIEPSADAQIIYDTETGPAITNTFAGFRSGIGWIFGTGSHDVARCSFTDCGTNVRLWGDVENNIVLNNDNQLMGGGIYVKEAATLTFSPDSEIHSSGTWLDFHVNGVLKATETSFSLDTWTDINNGDHPDERHSAIYFLDGSEGDFELCEFFSDERRDHSIHYYDDWSSILYCEGSVQLSLKGCSLESLNRISSNWHTTYGIYLSPQTQAFIGDYTEDSATEHASFKGFITGIYWPFGSGTAQIANCRYTDISSNIRIAGDVIHNITLPVDSMHSLGNITVKSGSTLSFPQGSEFYSQSLSYVLTVESGANMGVVESVFTMAHPMKISGTLDCRLTTMTLETWTDVNGGDQPQERFNGIDVLDGATAYFTKCVFKSIEKRDHSIHYYDDWSAIINTEGSSTLVADGCSFESLNSQNPSWWTTFGIRLTGGVDAYIQDYSSENPAARNSFKNFHTGIEWEFGSAVQRVAVCDFSGCNINVRLVGDVSRGLNMRNTNQVMATPITILTNGILDFNPGSQLANAGNRLMVNGGSIIANQTEFILNTLTDYNGGDNPGERWNGIDLGSLGTGTFDRCTFRSYEGRDHSIHYYDDWSAVINTEADSNLTVKGCSFETLNTINPAWWTIFGIRITGNVQSWIGDSTSGGTPVPTVFKNFRTGIQLDLGSTSPWIGTCEYENCILPIRTGGNVSGNVLFPVNVSVYLGSNITVKSGGHLTFPDSCILQGQDRKIKVESGGALECENTQLWVQTNRNSGDWNERNAFYFDDGSSGVFNNCSIYFYETGTNIYEDCVLYATGDTDLSLQGCLFTPHPDRAAGPYPYHVIWSEISGNLSIQGCAFLNTHATGLLIKNSFPATRLVQNNHFQGNSFAINNNLTTTLLARSNWWGSPSGPTHSANPGGTGDPVSNYVDYGNYLLESHHPAIIFLDPDSGQEMDNFGTAASQQNVELLGFQVVPTSSGILQIAFRIFDRTGIDAADISNLRIMLDANGNGNIDAGENQVIADNPTVSLQAADLVVVFPGFTSSTDPNHNYILAGDFTGLADGDRLRVEIKSGLIQADYGMIPDSRVSSAFHIVGSQLVMADPSTGQEPDNLNSSPQQDDVELLGFRFIGSTRQILSITFDLSNISNIKDANIVSAKLVRDANKNGAADNGETAVGGPGQISISGSTGYILFGSSFSSDGNFIVVADFMDLPSGAALAVNLSPANVSLLGGESVFGYVSQAAHQVDSAYILSESHYWVKPASFGATPSQSSYPLLGFILFPGGRDVDALKIGISGMTGILPEDISNAKLWWDFNGNGTVEAGDVLLDTGVLNIVNGEGFIEFNSGFVTRADLIVTANFINLAEYDEFTAFITAQEIEVPGGGLVLGSGPKVRHAVDGGIADSRGENQNWTLVYRSPGGQSVNGRFNHAGDLLILGYDTGSAWIYDTESNTPLMMLKEHYDKVMYAGFNSDDTAAVTVTRDGAVFIWDLATGSKRSEMFSDLLVTSAIPSPDFSKLMVITEGKGLLLDLDLQKRLWEFVPGDATVNAIAYSADGQYIAIGSSDKRAYIVDAETGVEVNRFLVHTQAVTAVGFTGDGKYLMTSSTDATAQVIDLDTEEVVNSISLQGQSSQTAMVSNDGARVAMITGTGNSALLRMFDENGLELFAVNIATESGYRWGGTVVSLCFDDTGERVLVTSGGEWAPVACFRSDNGDFIRHWGPSGKFVDSFDLRTRISEDGLRIFYMTSWGLDLLSTMMGQPILTHPTIGSRGFDISADGSKLIWFNSSRLYLDQVTDYGYQNLQNHSVGFNYNALTSSRSGSMVIAGDRLFSTLTGMVMANYAVPDAEYRGAFSPDQRLWGFAIPNDKSIITMKTNDPKALLHNMMDTSPYTPYKMFYHPDGKRVACVNNTHAQNPGVQFFDMDTYLPVGLYRFEQNSDACLSRDGSMLLIGGANNVRLFDVNTGRIIRYFFPQHSGLTNVNVKSVQFAKDDTMIMIAWSQNYIELYERSKAVRLKISPASRTFAPEESQAFTVEVEYDDGTSDDVSPSPEAQLGEAVLSVIPSTQGAFAGNVLTLSSGASGLCIVQARYRVNNRTFSAEAIVTVGQSHIKSLVADPQKMTISPGIFRPIRYIATFTDGYETDVTGDVVQTSSKPNDVVFADHNVKVLFTADPGAISIVGKYTDRYGTVKTAETIVSVFGRKTQWERYRVTGGGYGLSGDFSPGSGKFAAGSSSGAVNFYNVGNTPSQYELERILIAHEGMTNFVGYLSDSRLITASDEGSIKLWDVADYTTEPLSVYYHTAPISTAVLSSDKTKLAFGDKLGNVALLDIASNMLDWNVTAHTSAVNAVALDDTYVLSGGKDNRAKVMNRSTGVIERSILTHTKPVVGVGFLTTNSFFLVSEDKTASFWRKSDFEILDRYEFPTLPTCAAMLKGQLYIAMKNPASTYIYNSDGLLLRWLEHPPSRGRIYQILVDPSNNYILTGRGPEISEYEDIMGNKTSTVDSFCSFQFWETGRGIFRGSLAHSFNLIDAKTSSDASTLYTQDSKRTMVWNFHTDPTQVTGRHIMETGYFIKPSFAGMDSSGNGGILATRVDASIYMYDTAQDILWKTLHNPGGPCAFAISPNALRMATGDSKKVRLWDLIGLTQVREETRTVEALDFRLNDDFLGSIYNDRFVGVWNENGLLYNGIQTTFGPRKVFVNSTGERASVITEQIVEGLFGTEHLYYLEIYDVSKLSVEPPFVNKVFLLSVTKDLFGAGGDIPEFCIAVSDDTALALVGTTGDRPVNLISLNDGATIREFYPPSHEQGAGNGAAAVGFTDNDDTLCIAWSEGYASLYRRVSPLSLDVTLDTTGTLGGDYTDKQALDLAYKQMDAGVDVTPGQALRVIAIATFEDGSTMNVSASVNIIANKPDLLWINGSSFTIKPDALPDTVILTVKYDEPGISLQKEFILNIGVRVVNKNILKYYLLGYIQLTPEEMENADANTDLKVDIGDMINFMIQGK
jgi:WD40 repeat protein